MSVQSARKRLSAATEARQAAFERFDAAAAVALAEAPSPRLKAGLGAAVISAAAVAAWRGSVRGTVATLGSELRSAIRAAGEAVETIGAEVEAVASLAAVLQGHGGDLHPALPPSLAAAAVTLRASDPSLAVVTGAAAAEAARAVQGMVARACREQRMAREAAEVARHRHAERLLTKAGETRSAQAARLLGERAAGRLRVLRKAPA
jgi:hypothetical protein